MAVAAGDIKALNEKIAKASAFVREIVAEVGKTIVGQKRMVERLLVGLLAGGHVLLEGVPGLAKTLTVQTLCDAIRARFQRIQFTPDLLPADVVGTLIFNQKTGRFDVRKGPIFANFILADEINRAPAKVQSALLEAMQERQVTIGDETHPLPEPFMVLATQNPIEQEGTYPLPEAQVDRFMLKVLVTYPSKQEEREIIRRMAGEVPAKAKPVCDPKQIAKARETMRDIYVDEKVTDYILEIVFATRDPESYGIEKGLITWGASPRASIYLTQAARAMAFLQGRGYVTPEDVRLIGFDVLRHRVILSYEAEAEEVAPDENIRRVFDRVEVP